MGREETGEQSSWCYLVGPWHFGIKGRRGFRRMFLAPQSIGFSFKVGDIVLDGVGWRCDGNSALLTECFLSSTASAVRVSIARTGDDGLGKRTI